MSSQRELVRYRARQLGWQTSAMGLGTVGGIWLGVAVGAPWLVGAAVIVGGIATASAAWRWLAYRGENGLKF